MSTIQFRLSTFLTVIFCIGLVATLNFKDISGPQRIDDIQVAYRFGFPLPVEWRVESHWEGHSWPIPIEGTHFFEFLNPWIDFAVGLLLITVPALFVEWFAKRRSAKGHAPLTPVSSYGLARPSPLNEGRG